MTEERKVYHESLTLMMQHTVAMADAAAYKMDAVLATPTKRTGLPLARCTFSAAGWVFIMMHDLA